MGKRGLFTNKVMLQIEPTLLKGIYEYVTVYEGEAWGMKDFVTTVVLNKRSEGGKGYQTMTKVWWRR
jgi:hypothetical protein